MKNLTFLSLSLIFSLSGCSSLQTKNTTAQNLNPNPFKNELNQHINKSVDWTGYVLQTFDTSNSSCFEILESSKQTSLSQTINNNKSKLRFIACQNKKDNNKVYNHRLVTIKGNLTTFSKIGNNTNAYVYPMVETQSISIQQNAQARLNRPLNLAYGSIASREPYDLFCNGSNCYYKY